MEIHLIHGPVAAWKIWDIGIVAAFLCGSIPFGYLIGRWNGIDLRQHGSGNIGATNVWRVLGRKWGSLAFFLDFMKGFGPILLLQHWSTLFPEAVLVGAGFAAILGHNFTPWLGFKGGKGVATSAGVLAALLPIAFAIVLGVWIVLFFMTRIVSIASLGAAVALPIATFFAYPNHLIFFAFALLASALTIVRHRSNIGRIVRGEEKRIGSSIPK